MTNTLREYYDTHYRENGGLPGDPFPDKSALLVHIMQGWYERKRILDFGCGLGDFAAWMAAGAKSVTAVDYSKEAVTLATQRHLPSSTGNLDYQVRTEHDLPEGPFDLITCIGVLEHTDDPSDMIGEFVKVLSPSGMLIIQVPGWLNPRGEIYHTCRVLFGLKMTLSDRHWFTPRDMEGIGRQYGLSIFRIAGGHFRLGWGDRMVPDILERLEKAGVDTERLNVFTPWLEARASMTNLKLQPVPAAEVEKDFSDGMPWNLTGASTTYFIGRADK